MEIASSVAGEATNMAIVKVEHEFGYLVNFRSNASILKEKIKTLQAIKSDVETRIKAAHNNNQLIKESVQEWMKRADDVLDQARVLSDKSSFISSWFQGWCCTRFSLGRKVQKKIGVIQGLCSEVTSFDTTVSNHKPFHCLKLVENEDFNAFASRVYTSEKIHEALLETQTNLVGVYGMPGVGKTTLVKVIAKTLIDLQLFQEVVVIIISQNVDLKKLQEDVAEGLGLSFYEESLSTRAERLFERLSQDTQSTLVILDDVWDRIELSEIGIPYKNKGSYCKVVFVTRDRDVCDRMEADAKIEIEVLSKEDSQILFSKKTGSVADSPLAQDILNECKGLPLAIVTLGLALRNKDESIWADTLKQLRKSIFKGMIPVVSSIRLSYNFLESESTKICFLFCCLFPEDHKIEFDILLSYLMGEKLLEDVDTYEEARGRLHSMTDKLASSGLLLRDRKGNIRMHDVVRNVAISIATEEHGFIVKAGRKLIGWPNMELGNCKRLSMMHNSIKCLPLIQIKAPYLQALFLNDTLLTDLPYDVFADMETLKTLDLSRTGFKSLPSSFTCLQNLRTLLLNNTQLKVLSFIDELGRLEVLSLRDTVLIERFPKEMGKLRNLKILDLTGSSFVDSISLNIISKLHQLEEVCVLQNLFSHIAEPVRSRETDLFHELGSLSQLTSLGLQVYNPSLCCHKEIPGPWENLSRFQMVVKTFVADLKQGSRFSRSLWLEIPRRQVANWVLVLLGRTNYLELFRCSDLQNVIELGAKGMNDNLNSLKLESCPKMNYLTSNMGLLGSSENAFCNLDELHITAMGAFVEICKGTPPPKLLYKLKTLTFSYCHSLLIAIPCKLIQNMLNLEYLKVYCCNNLQYAIQTEDEEVSLVSNGSKISEPLPVTTFANLKKFVIDHTKIRYVCTMRVVRNLLQLEELMILNCREMEVIFKYADGEDIKCVEGCNDSAILPRLKRLAVIGAGKLKSFTTRDLIMDLASLEILRARSCGILNRLPFGTTSVPNLKTVEMNQELFDKLEWEDESVRSRLLAVAKE